MTDLLLMTAVEDNTQRHPNLQPPCSGHQVARVPGEPLAQATRQACASGLSPGHRTLTGIK